MDVRLHPGGRLEIERPSNVTWVDRFVHERRELRRYLSAADV
jgi:glycosyltransferase involved in cell wall biosynthesis